MCEILVKAIDHSMPTVQEWRDGMNSKGIPMANTFLAENPHTEETFTRAHAVVDYSYAIFIMDLYIKGDIGLVSEQVDRFNAIIQEIESNPPTEQEEAFLRGLLVDESEEIPSIECRWRYWKHLLDVDTKKTDEQKRVELEDKDRRGCGKQCMPVEPRDDGYDWKQHPEERLPKFWVIKLPLIEKEDFQPYCQAEIQNDELYRCREYQFDFSAAVINQLNIDGELTLNMIGWRNNLIRVGDK